MSLAMVKIQNVKMSKTIGFSTPNGLAASPERAKIGSKGPVQVKWHAQWQVRGHKWQVRWQVRAGQVAGQGPGRGHCQWPGPEVAGQVAGQVLLRGQVTPVVPKSPRYNGIFY